MMMAMKIFPLDGGGGLHLYLMNSQVVGAHDDDDDDDI